MAHEEGLPPSLLIVGTGAMACLFAARLAPHTQVHMLGTWAQGLAALEAAGVVLEEEGRTRTFPVRVHREPEACRGARYALVLVKSWQTARAGQQLKGCLAGDGIALTLQNGLGNLETLQDALGSQRAALGVTTTGATLLGPGRVRPGGKGPTYILDLEPLDPLVRLLEKGGFEVQRAHDLEALVWGKLAVNAGINPLTALLGVPNGELLERPDARQLMIGAAQETAEVARAKGVNLRGDMAKVVCDVASRTATNLSSMLQDVRRGAPTEIDAICGAVVKEGGAMGIPTPLNETLWHLVRALVDRKEVSP